MSTQDLYEGAEERSTLLPSTEPIDTVLPAEPPAFAPVEPSRRLANVDFARGVALLGILLVNVLSFFGPFAMLAAPSLLKDEPPHDRAAFVLIMALCFSKFFPVFSMLFGYGLIGQLNRAADAGRSAAGFGARRLGVLALFGAVHGLLLWYGDILFVYAVLGLVLLLARRADARGLLVIAACILFVAVVSRFGMAVLMGAFAADPTQAPAQPIPVPAGVPAPFDDMFRAGFNPMGEVWRNAETRAYRDGPWVAAQGFRAVTWLFMAINTVFFGWQILAMFFVGAALWRLRFFDPDQGWLRWRVFAICFPLGLGLESVAACFYWFGLDNHRLSAVAGAIQAFSTCILPLGYLSGLALLADALPDWARSPVASAGRMALTVYLLETVVATMLSYHWGFRLFGTIGVMTQALIALAIWAGLVAFSWLWLRFFRQGPMERLWRRLEYGRAAA